MGSSSLALGTIYTAGKALLALALRPVHAAWNVACTAFPSARGTVASGHFFSIVSSTQMMLAPFVSSQDNRAKCDKWKGRE